MGVDHGGTPGFGTDAVHPVIFIGEAATGPAQVGDIKIAQCLGDIVADAASVGNGGRFTYVNAAVNAATQMFGEMAINVATNGLTAKIGIDGHMVHDLILLLI
jgi:hypothetical protein